MVDAVVGTQAGANLAGMYRQLFTVVGSLGAGELIRGVYSLPTQGKLDILGDSGQILAQVVISAESRSLKISSFDGSRWHRVSEIDWLSDSGNLEITIAQTSEGPIEITFSPHQRSETIPAREGIGRLSGLGDWISVKRERVGSDGQAADGLSAALVSSRSAFPSHGPTLNKKLVFDLGFFDGADTSYYLWRGFDVVAVEANPVLADAGLSLFSSQIAAKRLSLVACAVGKQRGTLPFYRNFVHPEWSSTNRSTASRGYPVDEIMVETVTPLDLFNAFGVPHYLKIDIEGEDAFVLDSLASVDERPEFVSFEVGPQTPAATLRHLHDLGYRAFNIVNQQRVASTFDRAPNASEGTFTFKHGSSGAFGDRLGGAWLRLDAAVMWLEDFLADVRARRERSASDRRFVYGDWYDIHAAR